LKSELFTTIKSLIRESLCILYSFQKIVHAFIDYMNPITKAMAFMLSCITFLSSCTHYYHVYEPYTRPEELKMIDSLSKAGRYIILRSGDEAYNMNKINVDESSKSVTAELEEVSPAHTLHIEKGKRRHLSYSRSDETTKNVVNEVHIFIKEGRKLGAGSYSIQDTSIRKVEILSDDEAKTKKTRTMTIVGAVVSGILLTGLIVIFVQLSKLA